MGGLEAAHRAVGDNQGGITVMADCRGDMYKGRWGVRDEVPRSATVRMLHIPVSRLGKRRHAAEFRPTFGPIVAALAAGERVLIHCVNGRHRSALAAATILGPGFDTPGLILECVRKMRKLAEFSAPFPEVMAPEEYVMFYRQDMADLWIQQGLRLAQKVLLTRAELQDILEDGSDDLVASFTVCCMFRRFPMQVVCTSLCELERFHRTNGLDNWLMYHAVQYLISFIITVSFSFNPPVIKQAMLTARATGARGRPPASTVASDVSSTAAASGQAQVGSSPGQGLASGSGPTSPSSSAAEGSARGSVAEGLRAAEMEEGVQLRMQEQIIAELRAEMASQEQRWAEVQQRAVHLEHMEAARWAEMQQREIHLHQIEAAAKALSEQANQGFVFLEDRRRELADAARTAALAAEAAERERASLAELQVEEDRREAFRRREEEAFRRYEENREREQRLRDEAARREALHRGRTEMLLRRAQEDLGANVRSCNIAYRFDVISTASLYCLSFMLQYLSVSASTSI